MDIEDVAISVNAAEEGEFFPFGEDCNVKIAMWMNKKHRKFIRDVYAKHGRKIDARAISDEEADNLMLPQWQYVVKDWNGLTEKGVPIEYNYDNLIRLLRDKRLRGFFERIAEIAKEESNFRESNLRELGEELPTT